MGFASEGASGDALQDAQAARVLVDERVPVRPRGDVAVERHARPRRIARHPLLDGATDGALPPPAGLRRPPPSMARGPPPPPVGSKPSAKTLASGRRTSAPAGSRGAQ